MANSLIVTAMKDAVIRDMVLDDAIVTAIDSKTCENPGDLVGTHIFRYNRNPKTISQKITFITVMVHTKARDAKKTFVTPVLEIWIYTHNGHMEIKNIPGIYDSRNDYISKLLDLKFNGSTQYGGIGKLLLTDNSEGIYNENFMYRRLIFETVDLSDSTCDRW